LHRAENALDEVVFADIEARKTILWIDAEIAIYCTVI
jgi:hypothetical protein